MIKKIIDIIIPPVQAAPVNLKSQYEFGNYSTLGQALDTLIPVLFMVAGVSVTFYLLLGAVRFITSGGDKEKINSGKYMIIHAVIGIVLLIVMFLFIQFFTKALGLVNFVLIRNTI